ncbi:DUF4145 domain-containing protein, partial [Magnetococcales bacterium HHB-1]
EWAHTIRMIGNEAAHEITKVSLQDAKAIFYFLEIFLTYLFTLPAKMEARRGSSVVTSKKKD